MRTIAFDRRWQTAACLLLVGMALPLIATTAFGQEAGDKVRVPTSYANVHMGPSSGQQILVLVPKDTVLTVTGRRGEWIEVELDPILMKLGMKMRWYENEDRGWMHETTVDIIEE